MTHDARPVNLNALAKLPPDEPVVMINLLKFNDTVGVDSYRQYGIAVQPHLNRVGGRVVYSGGNPWAVIGDDERPWWDAILVVEYPSPQAFVDMVTDPGYQEIHHHRADALSKGDLIATSTWAPG